ncbi:hypothetical protein PAXRUDRAFT_784661, partial [Paxillus rubicundulus Ve08.2h10]
MGQPAPYMLSALGHPIPHSSYPLAHPLPLCHPPWAAPLPMSPQPTYLTCICLSQPIHPILVPLPRPTRHHQVSIHWPTHYLPLHFSVTYSILLHPQLLDPWPAHTLQTTPFLGSPIGHGKYFPSAHPIPTAPPPPQ